ncbi:MAG TPA: peptidoglycan-binding domain-containing protein, partial [Candidatus Paceibacterota bacterium]|nr:peptidoglycan-binding domain-containing protein [Candidatus Paceibacterota bacterium]
AVAGDAQVTLGWIAPPATGGITGYAIAWANGTTTVGTVTSTVITGLMNGTSYSFKVNTINPVGQSAVVTSNTVVPSVVSTSTATPPSPPPGISVSNPATASSPDNQALQSQLNSLMAQLQTLLAETNKTGTATSSTTITAPVVSAGSAYVFSRNLYSGLKGDDVAALQKFLIAQSKGSVTAELRGVGATGYFGPLTAKALAEFQASAGISPASGYFGPITRAYVSSHSGQ